MEKEAQINREVAESLLEGMQNMRLFLLKSKSHIKKYLKYRKLHAEVLNSMINYMDNGNYDLVYELDNVGDSLKKETKIDVLSLDLDFEDDLEYQIYLDLSVYKNHDKMRCITDDYLEKHKFKNAEKINMLHAMRESFSSFFKIVKADEDGYVCLEDMVTNKRYKVIDITLSNPFNKTSCYLFTRIITMDGIYFMTRAMFFPQNIKKVNNYIKEYKRKRKSDLVRILEVYHLYEEFGIPSSINYIS